MKNLTRVLLLFVVLIFCSKITAQNVNDSTLIQIETIDGNRFIGKISSENSEKLMIVTDNLGEIVIQVSDIKSRKIINDTQIKNGEFWFDNPQSTRYFWAPNGYGLEKGEGYYQNVWILWNQVAYGITDNFSIGGTVIPLFLFGGASTPLFINPKLSIPVNKNKFNVGAGALVGTVIGGGDSGFGLVYGVSTLGSPDNNISIGLGYGFAGGEWTSAPLVNISGMARLSSRWYLLSENYYMAISGESGGVISGGARWIIKSAALDFGLFIPIGTGIGTFIALPWLGFTVPFGKVN